MARHRLKQRRIELGLMPHDVAERLGVGERSVKRYESGESTPLPGRRRRYAEILEWSLAQLSLALNGDGDAPNAQAVPSWLGHLASLEQGASDIWWFEPIVVPGLLQTPGYAAAVERADVVALRTEEGIAERVRVRMARQRVLTRQPDPLQLSVVLDESVLHRVAGDSDIMAAQLNHLAEAANWSNVELRILPLTAGVFIFGPFTVLTAPGSSQPYMAVVEDRAGPNLKDRPHDIEAHVRLFRGLADAAMEPPDSIDLIRTVCKERYR